jgi:hypothetical protein
MRKFTFLLVSAALILSLNAWGATADGRAKNTLAQKTKKCLFPKSRKRAPGWVCNTQEESLSIAAVGSFHKSGAGAEFTEQMATADARAKLVGKLNAPVQRKIADSDSSPNRRAAKPDRELINRISDETLQGTRVLKKAYGPKGRLYVLIGFDETDAQKLQETIVAAYLEQQNR